MKIVDKLTHAAEDGKPLFSFEFFPPRTEEGVENLFERLDRMASYGPAFCDITWGAGGSTADVTLDIATKMQTAICVETMMHLTCTNMPVEKLHHALNQVKKAGIMNILALRGDPPKGQDEFKAIEGGFSCALDLVKFIRKEFGSYFGITVAGYPEAHPDGIVDDPEQMQKNYWADIQYLKQKVDAGGEVIVTQLFYDVDLFLKFVKDCRSVGIEAPILPGVMPILTYNGFKRMTGFCKTHVPAHISDTLEGIKDDDDAVKKFGVQVAVDMCRRILDAGVSPGIHLYTLNLERSAVAILEQLGLLDTSALTQRRVLPWRSVPQSWQRAAEGVRPIFWANRPRSYLSRTADWDSFPSGRWGDARSPAYGTLSDYQFMRRHTSSAARRERALSAWGDAPADVDDVTRVFTRYWQGEISVLPWSELEGHHVDAGAIRPQLCALTAAGLLVINTQPHVNAAPSDDPQFGWGGPGGYVYQKAYVEFFASPQRVAQLLPALQANRSITYMATDAAGRVQSNLQPEGVDAVTWGVFPGKEVVQPHVVDRASFAVWSAEAFDLWLSEWGALYEDGSPASRLLRDMHDTWSLVCVVDNDYVQGDLFALLLAALTGAADAAKVATLAPCEQHSGANGVAALASVLA